MLPSQIKNMQIKTCAQLMLRARNRQYACHSMLHNYGRFYVSPCARLIQLVSMTSVYVISNREKAVVLFFRGRFTQHARAEHETDKKSIYGLKNLRSNRRLINALTWFYYINGLLNTPSVVVVTGISTLKVTVIHCLVFCFVFLFLFFL